MEKVVCVHVVPRNVFFYHYVSKYVLRKSEGGRKKENVCASICPYIYVIYYVQHGNCDRSLHLKRDNSSNMHLNEQIS